MPALRQAKHNELARVIYITKLAYKIPYKADTLITRPHEPEDIVDQFKRKGFFIIVVSYHNKIVGAVRYKFDKKGCLCFYKLAVLKTYRNLGIATSLIGELEKIAVKQGCAKILLYCVQEKKLDDFYKKFGFQIDKIKPHLDHHNVYMSKKIKIKNFQNLNNYAMKV
ncbi:GNAT family N-acetyltransferase [Patescibacteria group bacterium]|nr:GNAT family N-acetyltransferase [Patescibacteria group bacterium]MBU1519403.1 GNAT family N-acetyltransferase [Patescibacteria group bacterium]MBU1956731.1 GNAT family N-acetyltransferase [Patescibacteria group bacterium]MBU2416586.1 GNAT family N-acetyltransferase [Patescibacteria group bacterium]MBU2460738.1 GNAT family N-acetyltransferase [Patescibacteria group bacterium]